MQKRSILTLQKILSFKYFLNVIFQKKQPSEEKATERKQELAAKLTTAATGLDKPVSSQQDKKKYVHALRMSPEGTQNTDTFDLILEFDQEPAVLVGEELVNPHPNI